MDLESLDIEAAANNGADMVLRHPVGDEDLIDKNGKPITIRVLGVDSKEFRRVVDRIGQKAGNKKRTSLAERERQQVDMLSAITIGWSGIDWGGKPLEFTPENVKMLYRERPWVRGQVDEFVADRGNFFKSD